MCGGVPFAEEVDDPYLIYEEIMATKEISFAPFLKDRKAKKLIE
jgi:cGMP-dependent protein kinase